MPRLFRRLPLLCATAAVVLSARCAKSVTGPSDGQHATLVGAGDIAYCEPFIASGSVATGRLLDRIDGMVFTAGDNTYPAATANNFSRCYEPAWGRHKARTRPSPGNHDYESDPGAAPYFAYFGGNAGPSGAGYYSYRAGSWLVLSLNSEVAATPGSPQLEWVRAELANNRTTCAAAYWHRPLFSSGLHGNNAQMRDLWRVLYDANVDLVIGGHDHTYERFGPQDPDGRPDTARGIREFIVGTGGAPNYDFPLVRPNSEVRAAAWGVTVFTLLESGYQWEFVPVEGGTFRDSGSGGCH
jgi:hypothetical protein